MSVVPAGRDKEEKQRKPPLRVGRVSSLSFFPSELRGARLGLGAASEVEERLEQRNQPPPKTDDPFELYRRQRAGKYHDVIATRYASKTYVREL